MSAESTETKSYFTQRLDHFNNLQQGWFQQKYYVLDDYYQPSTSPAPPIFLYINGEAPCTGTPDNWVRNYAQEFGALIVTLEHRYYGESQPFADLSTEHLTYLSSKQAIEDIAHFIRQYNSTLAPPNSGWITVGCSYPGALSSWFRLKHPDLTLGSLSSSGVVNAILDFYQFDQQVSSAISLECASRLRTSTQQIEAMLQGTPQEAAAVKQAFQAEYFEDDGDFYYMIADAGAETVQYGFQNVMCGQYMLPAKNESEYWKAFAQFTTQFWYPTFEGGPPVSYTTKFQQIIKPPTAARAWWFQQCSEFGWFQTAPAQNSIRSSQITVEWYLKDCEKVFGRSMFPRVYETNSYYGGDHIRATQVYYANSSQDPWKAASLTNSTDPLQPAHVIVCEDCGHCSDLRGCPSLPSNANMEGCHTMADVNATRQAISQA